MPEPTDTLLQEILDAIKAQSTAMIKPYDSVSNSGVQVATSTPASARAADGLAVRTVVQNLGDYPLAIYEGGALVGYAYAKSYWHSFGGGQGAISLAVVQGPTQAVLAENDDLVITGPINSAINIASGDFTVRLKRRVFNGVEVVQVGDFGNELQITPSVGSPDIGSVGVTPVAGASSFTFKLTGSQVANPAGGLPSERKIYVQDQYYPSFPDTQFSIPSPLIFSHKFVAVIGSVTPTPSLSAMSQYIVITYRNSNLAE